ncbi:NAD binding domain of 6-phosphogluconate dehydrogenase-domain-containing protein [Microdochium trichocladiopsis]|uniref:NAD binding domain of 6-phosphogluconate dehydrogenase-domain-containing protein n=1 Tax=Microdochium trichocladiopsis TaxID=1682393 RepID=A0A9P9BMX1_9PEZI|nr:NAD binding domain of 6-phosphogluconate dehydrogenase-domain-containing protein [Microdochium trichocladiopsis]KAH7030661.1 NAD binding domain of 6-phosphogluconate dehydrogenase-domain-containing protein [Microdochium trichocladiopsis]
MASKPDVAFIGLGAMGFGMATHLVKQGYPVHGFDVYPPILERFTAAGGKAATTPAEAAQGKAFCVVMVANSIQTQAALLDGPNAAVPALPQGATILLCSTVACGYVQSLERQLVDIGRPDILLIDAPVSGGVIRATDGTLSIMVGASEAALAKGKFLLEEMSDPAKLYIGQGGIGAGSNLKMVHQVLAAVHILAAGESLAFAKQLGLDPAWTAERVIASDTDAFMFSNRLPRILAAADRTLTGPVASAVTIILKDNGIITSEAVRHGFATPMTSTSEQVYYDALGRGWGALDDGVLIQLYDAGQGKVGPLVASTAATTDEDKLKLVQALLRGIYLCSAAETLAYGSFLGMDLDQIYELCANAAGGSAVFRDIGPAMIEILKGGKPSEDSIGLRVVAAELQTAVLEAQRLKMPVFLGAQALNLIRLALNHAPKSVEKPPRALLCKVWSA